MSETNAPSDWIYVILTLFAAGASLIQSVTKKKKPTSQQKQTSTTPWAGDFADEDQEEEVVDYTITEYKSDSRYLFTPEEEGKKGPEAKTDSIFFNEENTETETDEIEFDLKEAIVYNEILNRKYE